MKRCTKCGETKPLDAFNRDKSRPDGRQWRCKACQKVRRATYYAANRDAEAEQVRAYQQANREAVAERNRKYNAENPHVYWQTNYRRRARQFGFEPVVESFTRDDLVARYGDKCFHCGGEWTELDHWPKPVSEGGPHALENVRPSCTPCNRRTWRKAA